MGKVQETECNLGFSWLLGMRVVSQEVALSVVTPQAHPWAPGIDLCCMLQPFWATCYSLMILWFLISMPLYHLVPLVEVARCPFPLPFFCICISLWLSSSVTSSGKTCFYHTVNTLCLCFFGLCLDFHYSHPGNIFLVPVFFKALNVGTMSIPHPTPTPFFYLKPSPQ